MTTSALLRPGTGITPFPTATPAPLPASPPPRAARFASLPLDVLPQGSVDQRLVVAAPCTAHLLAKPIEQLRIEADRDPCLPLGGLQHGTAPAGGEVHSFSLRLHGSFLRYCRRSQGVARRAEISRIRSSRQV